MKRHAFLLSAVLLMLSALSYAQAPVPFINLPLIPDATAPGGPQFTLTVNGTGFVSNSVVNWNGAALATQFVNQSQLTATVPAANIATATTGWITVVNPAPGGGTSSVAFFTTTYNTGNSVVFNPPSSPPTDTYPTSVAVGDFNEDGILDLVEGSDVLLGDGNGNFTLAPRLNFLGNLSVGDFNGDGKLDLAAATIWSNPGAVLVSLGDGAGDFTQTFSLPIGWPDGPLAIGDFNGDGKLDIAVLDGANNTVWVLLGNGTGNFTLASSPATGDGPNSVAVGDFNGDGRLDLAVVNGGDNTVSILLGDGTGNFTLASLLTAGYDPSSVAVGDFNGDGKLDLAVADPSTVSIYIFQGDGTGNFTLARTLYTPYNNPNWVAVGDFNGDGILDLAVANCENHWPDGGSISVMLGDGTGNFNGVTMPGIAAGVCPASIAVGDFNGDGRLDLAFTGDVNQSVNVLLQVPPTPAVTLYPASLTFGTQLFGTSSYPQPVMLTNSGSAPLNITRVATSANYSQTNNCGHTLAAGANCTINVIFKPHNVGTLTGTITITDNAPTSPQTVPLTGVGTAVTLLPSSLNFGDQQVGTTSQPQTVTLTNYAPKAVTILGGDFTGSNSRTFAVKNSTCGKSLPPTESCTASLTFTPKDTGPKSATFNVNDNGGASPQTVALSGTGTN